MARDRGGHHPAGAPVRGAARRSVRSTTIAGGGRGAGGTAFRAPEFSLALPRDSRHRQPPADLCRRHFAHHGRPMVGPGRQDPNAVRAGVCARKPSNRVARLSRPSGRSRGALARRLLLRDARDPAAALAGRRSGAGGGADAGLLQRDLFRACLPRAAARPAAGRRKRSDGARGYRLPEDTGRAAAGACDFPQAGRRLLRSGRAAGGFVARRARAHFGRAGRPSAHRQRPGQRGARIGGVDGIHSRCRAAAARRAAASRVGRDLVVRREAGPGLRRREHRTPGRQAGIPQSALRTGLRPRPAAGRARVADRADHGPAACLRGAGAPGVLPGARVARRGGAGIRGARPRDPRVRDRDAHRLSSDAGRPGAHRPRRRRHRFNAARRRQQGHLGAG